jgi:hypothetical protein
MLGAIIGDIVGSIYEVGPAKLLKAARAQENHWKFDIRNSQESR